MSSVIHGALVIAVVLAAFGATDARAGTFGVPVPYPTIQAGIRAASTGDTVLVADGTYTGAGNRNIDFEGKDVVLRSASGAAATVIDCNAAGRAFYLYRGETNAAVIEGFTIQRGLAGVSQYGGGIYCRDSSPTIRDCVIRLCTVPGTYEGDGGGICLFNSTGRIERCTISANNAVYGGGVAFRGTTAPTITGCAITWNRAAGGAGIDAGGIGAPRILDCTISANTSTGGSGGGGLFLGGTPLVSNCTITGNLAGMGGGISCWNGVPVIQGCTVSGNFAQTDKGGGLVALMSSQPSLDRTILWQNCAATFGDEIAAEDQSVVSLACCIVHRAGVAEDGGIVHYTANDIDADPRFCSNAPCGAAPTIAGTYTVDRYSPAPPDQNPCGSWIGSRHVIGCPAADVAGIPPAHTPLLDAVSPNPVSDRLSCAIRLSRPAHTVLRVISVTGRAVGPVLERDLPAGRSVVSIRLGDRLRGGGLSSGTYFLRLETDGRTESRPIVLVR